MGDHDPIMLGRWADEHHSLILCLIVTNALKSVAYSLVPARIWSGAVVADGDRFCLFSGWLLALTVEAVGKLHLGL